jgi:hypothetical protein
MVAACLAFGIVGPLPKKNQNLWTFRADPFVHLVKKGKLGHKANTKVGHIVSPSS